MLHDTARVRVDIFGYADGAGLGKRSGHGHEGNDAGKDHEIGVEEDENAGMVEVPSALEATKGLDQAPGCDQERKELPIGAVQIVDIREAGETEAGRKGAEREEDGAGEGFLP